MPDALVFYECGAVFNILPAEVKPRWRARNEKASITDAIAVYSNFYENCLFIPFYHIFLLTPKCAKRIRQFWRWGESNPRPEDFRIHRLQRLVLFEVRSSVRPKLPQKNYRTANSGFSSCSNN